MADENQGVQNKKVLIIAILLAVVVVIVYNVHIMRIKNELKGKSTKLLKYRKDLSAGNKISRKDIVEVEVPSQAVKNLSLAIKADAMDYILQDGGKKLLRSVEKGNLVFWADVQPNAMGGTLGGGPSPGKVYVSLEVRGDIGESISIGSNINLMGVFPLGGKNQYVRIIEGVEVVGIGGKTSGIVDTRKGSRSTNVRQRKFRDITLELSKERSLELLNALTHATGEISLELNCSVGVQSNPKINPKLKSFTTSTAFSSKGGSTSTGGSVGLPPPR